MVVGRLVHCFFAHDVVACLRAIVHTQLLCGGCNILRRRRRHRLGRFDCLLSVSGSILSQLWCQFLGIDVYKNITSRQYAMEWQASRARVRLFYSQLIQNSVVVVFFHISYDRVYRDYRRLVHSVFRSRYSNELITIENKCEFILLFSESKSKTKTKFDCGHRKQNSERKRRKKNVEMICQ